MTANHTTRRIGPRCGGCGHDRRRSPTTRRALRRVRQLNSSRRMTKSLTGLALTLSLAFATTAVADPAADKQIAACEKIRTGIAKNTKCPDQAKAASELTCSAATAPQVKTLFDDCMKVLTTKPAAGSKVVTCKGLDDAGAELASATGASTLKCGK